MFLTGCGVGRLQLVRPNIPSEMFEPVVHPQPDGNTRQAIAVWVSDYQDALDNANGKLRFVCDAGGWCKE